MTIVGVQYFKLDYTYVLNYDSAVIENKESAIASI